MASLFPMILISTGVLSHPASVIRAELAINDHLVHVTLHGDLRSLLLGGSPGHTDVTQQALWEQASADERSSRLTEWASRAATNTVLSFGPTSSVSFSLLDASLDPNGVGRLLMQAALPENASTYAIQFPRDLGPVSMTAHRGPEVPPWTILLEPGERSPAVDPSSLASYATTRPTLRETALQYLVFGYRHIIPEGWDHVLFILGLFLSVPAWRPLLMLVTLFTLAHSLTLALAATGVVSLPAEVVEPLIAASIVWVAIENIRGVDGRARHRKAIVVGFGLLHGLGFAGVLAELGLPADQRFVALAAFNIGVEIGQVAILIAATLLTAGWRTPPTWTRISRVGSAVLAAFGMFWLITRLTGFAT